MCTWTTGAPSLLTEVLGYDGPIIMTHVTRALAPPYAGGLPEEHA
jgi:hypothetical protein